MENNGECSQKRVSQQTTLNFPVLSYTHFDSSNKKGKNKLVDHIDHGEVANNEKETTPLKPIKQLKQITLNFPSITNNIRKKRFFSDIDTDDNGTDIDEESDDDECSDDEYNAVPRDGEPHIHVRSKKACNAKIQGQHSVEKYFKSSSDEIPLSMQFPCQGLSNDQIKHYILHCPSDFGGSKRETELACQLFPQKFKDGHLVYSKLNSDERQELYSLQRAHATWFLDRGNLSVTSAKCKKFTARESKICEDIQDNRLVQLLGDDKLKTLYGNAIDEESDKCNMWTKLAEYGKKGAFKTNKTFSELVELMLQIKKIQEQGKSKRAVRYSEHLHHFFSLLSDSSREYGIFRKMLVGMDPRSIRYLRVRNGDYLTNPNLMYENLARFARAMEALKWTGPVVAMTDCTKIRTKLTYSQELGCIVGSTLSFDSTNVITYDDIHLKIKEIQDNKAIASQVRCVVLKIPISRIPPVVIALLPTKGDSKTQEIYAILKKIVDMSIQANINLISIGADGAITEYNAQVLLMQGNDTQEFLTYDNEIYNVHFRAPIYSGKPIIRYIFDFDTCISDINIEILRSWPSDDDINDAIRIASENAKEFSNFLQMKKQSKNTSYTDPLIPELSETNTNNLLTNEVVPQNITIDQVADELNRISQLENVFDDYFENNDISDNSRHEYSEDLLEINTADADNFIMKTEINYIINNPKTTVLQELNHEPEEKIFEKEGSCDIFLMLELRRSHEAFSRSDHPRGIQTRISVNLNQESQDKIDRNLANHLVNQLSNNQDHQIMRSRTQRWKGRNQLQSLVNSNKMQVTNIGCANVSQAHPLKKDGYLLVFTDGRLCIAKVIAMYQMIGGKHSFVTGTIDNIDLLSYISVSLFINIYGDSLFSNECIAGGRLYAHLKSKDIVYYFGVNVPFMLHSNSLLTLDDNSLEIYSFFKKEETQLHLASIFDNRDINCND
ncbi:uncharacterized protein OCT59_022679 [Rhizophagus irregularis]|uniref:uncharacterized protein n=1 Tax=Rhizophagus irregularis TaxID=588596 RepID=UPI00331A9E24|nr:hypothetical protein OCT59_022679 [Rhizophagus irregularis]